MLEDIKQYESAIARAHKLAALAFAASAAPGESEAAKRKLAEHMEKYHLTPNDLEIASRKKQWFRVVGDHRYDPVKRDKKLAHFAALCLWYVVAEKRPYKIYPDEMEMPSKGLKIIMKPHYSIEAETTAVEYADWKNCFNYYFPHFTEHLDRVRADLRAAKYAAEVAVPAFCTRNEILPPIDPTDENRPASIRDLVALIGAKKVGGFRTPIK